MPIYRSNTVCQSIIIRGSIKRKKYWLPAFSPVFIMISSVLHQELFSLGRVIQFRVVWERSDPFPNNKF